MSSDGEDGMQRIGISLVDWKQTDGETTMVVEFAFPRGDLTEAELDALRKLNMPMLFKMFERQLDEEDDDAEAAARRGGERC